MSVTTSSSNTLPRVLGVLIARNEWPLLGISITHALVNHVDEIIVVDHASTDETQAGLKALQKRWGSKLQILHLCESTFHHEETNLLLKSMYENRDFDWVYPIDADEFFVTQNNLSLRELLAQIPPKYEVARYELHNFVAPVDFVEDDFQRYGEICNKAVVNPDFKITRGDYVESIVQGELSFFEVPFPSKVIFRLPHSSWASSGSHSMLGVSQETEFKLSEEHTFVAHIPFLTRERLERRAERGKTLVNSGYGRDHGWQSQVINQMHLQGRLDEYWKRNSIDINAEDSENGSLKTIKDNRLVQVLEAAVAEFQPTLGVLDSNQIGQPTECESSVTLSQGVQSIRAMGQLKESGIKFANSQNQALSAEVASLHAENSQLHAENSQLHAENSQLHAENVHLHTKNMDLINLMSWRITSSIRLIHNFVKKANRLF